jgi:hypothetical protein
MAMGQLILILGMHRSGTSFLTEVLQSAGLFLGSELMDSPRADNMDGHFEAWEAIRINDRILTLSGGRWDCVPTELRIDAETIERMEEFLRELSSYPIAGWKDPRTTLTFPLWKPRLPQYQIVACFRHPLSVAKSLQVRDDMPLNRGLELWARYNERLLQIEKAEGHDLFWFDFDLPPAELRGTVLAIAERLGFSRDRVDHELFNPFLRHQSASHESLEPRFQELYEKLKVRESRQRKTWGGLSSQATDVENIHERLARQFAEFKENLAHIVRVQNRHNILLQRLQRVVEAGQCMLEETRAQLVDLSNQCLPNLLDAKARLDKVERRVLVNALIRWWRKLKRFMAAEPRQPDPQLIRPDRTSRAA